MLLLGERDLFAIRLSAGRSDRLILNGLEESAWDMLLEGLILL